MTDLAPQFEGKDNAGEVKAYSGVVGQTVVQVPSTQGKVISGFMFSIKRNALDVSLDGGLTFFRLPKNALGFKNVKGEIKQLHIKCGANTGTSKYNLWIDFEDF